MITEKNQRNQSLADERHSFDQMLLIKLFFDMKAYTSR